MRSIILGTITAMLAAAATAAQAPTGPVSGGQATLAEGRRVSDWSSRDSVAALAALAAPPLQQAIAGAGGPDAFVAAIAGAAGRETRVIDEFAVALNDTRTYSRLAAFERAPAMLTTVVWDAAGTIVAASVRPSTAPLADTAAPFPVRAPFAAPRAGGWYTFWGGGNAARNYHVVAPAQRHAYDFVVVRAGRSFAGPPTALASYFCWGEPVLAAADGTVVTAVADRTDQAIGSSDRANPAGNHVVIRHAPDRHSLVAHLQQGSVTVKVGQPVRAGDLLGRCGNSGNTSEPHVHFHLQTGATMDAGGSGVPAAFAGLDVDGRPARPGEPVRGQMVVPNGRRGR